MENSTGATPPFSTSLKLNGRPVDVEINDGFCLAIEDDSGARHHVALPSGVTEEDLKIVYDRATGILTLNVTAASPTPYTAEPHEAVHDCQDHVEHPCSSPDDDVLLDPLLIVAPEKINPALRLRSLPGKGKG